MTQAQRALPFKGRQDTTHAFEIDYTSGDGTLFRGKFVSKKLSIRDVAAMGVRKAQLNGGMHHDSSNPGHGVDYNTDEFNQMIAHLEIALVTTPPWWDLSNIHDVQVMAKVWEEVVQFETSFLERTRLKKHSSGSGSSDKELAQEIKKEPTLLERLAKWWVQKYKLPSNHELFLERTLDDLELEFWVDYYDANPLEAHRNEAGEIQFHHPDDPLFNKWEEQVAKGEIPDLTEAFDTSALDKIRKRAKTKKSNPDKGMSFKEVTELMDRENSALSRRVAKNKHLQPPLSAPKTFGHKLED